MAETPSDGYLTPTYIQYEGAVADALNYRQIYVYDDITPPADTIGKVYIKLVNSWLAQGEAIAQKNLQNYVAIPLVWENGAEFNSDLTATPQYKPTHDRILSYFINYGLLIVANNYYAGLSDKATGKSVYEFYETLTNKFHADTFRLDQSTNSQIKNLFYGLRTVANASNRTPLSCQSPQMQGLNGANAEFMAQNSIPNYRYGIRR